MTLTPSRGNARSDSEPRLTEAGFFFCVGAERRMAAA